MIKENSLIIGDCLEILKDIKTESVDLCYIDPPFFTQRDFEDFSDKWGSLEDYISWLEPRVREIHRVLKPTGSFYLHCDWHANSYIRVNILDKIFGKNNFRNEIIWKKTSLCKIQSRQFGSNHETLYFYSKTSNFSFNKQYENSEIQSNVKTIDFRGRSFVTSPMTQGGQGNGKFFGSVFFRTAGR
jgi:site-specific DNA-methyltransferase (adenine-specific)